MQTGTNFSESFTAVYEDERSFLEKTVNDHPVSALSLFLLLQNYKNTGDERYNQLLQKAALYFPNHTWLNYQLSGDESMNYIPDEIIQEEEEEDTFSETDDLLETIFVEPEIKPITAPETEPEPENKSNIGEETATENSTEEEAIREMEKEEMVEFVRGEKADNFEKTFVANESNSEGELKTGTTSEKNIVGQIKPEGEEIEEETENKLPEVLPEESASEAGISKSSEVPQEAAIPPETTNASLARETEDASKIEDIATSPVSEVEAEKQNENQSIEFEPLHTIDYFASQGIIIREEALMNDKLGKQMKSFTDWLKSMKKLHPGRLPEQNEVVEKIIQSSAELSNEDAGVLTEAMADVLIKQGKREKAIEMFEKLSLMNPSKSIYFAAKIESLKK